VGAPVSIENRAGGKGKLVISYSSLDELDGILSRIH
jgi:ParB family chromosome partitioning protein